MPVEMEDVVAGLSRKRHEGVTHLWDWMETNLPLSMSKTINDIATQLGELNNKNSMALWNYDNGFFDVFVDESRILNMTNTVISAGGGKIGSDPIIDDIESGASELGWESAVSMSVDNTSQVYGTYSIDNVSSAELTDVTEVLTNPVESGTSKMSIKIGSDVADAGDKVQLILQNGAGNIIFMIQFIDNGGAVEESYSNTTLLPSWTAGTTYDITIAWDFANNQADIDINGTTSTNVPFNIASSQHAEWRLQNSTSSSTATRHAFFDNYTYDYTLTETSGSITSIRKDIEFIPDKLVLSQKVTLDGENINYTVSDNSGNSVIVNQSDVDTEIDVSSFADGNIQVVTNFSRVSGGGSPKIDYFGVIFV